MSELVNEMNKSNINSNNESLNKKKELIQKIANTYVAKKQIYGFKNINEAKNSQLIKFFKEQFTGKNHFRPDWVNENYESKYNK